jgi:lipopolysaccharide transport system ATP-binding protein
MSTVIKVENLSKQYRLGLVGTGTFKEDTKRFWARLRGKEDPFAIIGEENDRTSKGSSNYVWSLRDINFDVEQGDILGVIGKNGAGKSTLLKILSKVTTPTIGSVKAKGRIASLLEVGTGFHPELTGRENIYLNGAILGMRKHEITRKLDEIIAFAGVERYIDTPVKRYSSGMYVRLAFAVAAHLENEILIIDEVLAVGDADFQKKCIGKIGEVSKGDGRTILFVSHNMAAINSLCTKGLFLSNGKFTFLGSQKDAILKYTSENNITNYYKHEGDIEFALGNDDIKLIEFKVYPKEGESIKISSEIIFELSFYNFKENINLDATFELSTNESIVVFHNGTIITENRDSKIGLYVVKGTIPSNLLNSGIYKFKLIFGENQRYCLFSVDEIIQFEVLNETIGSNSVNLPGIVRPNLNYNVYFNKQLF